MTAKLHTRYFNGLVKLVNARVGAKATKAYSISAITNKIIGCYDDRDTWSLFSTKS